MVSEHPQVVGLAGETHLYKLFYDPFTYLKGMGWRKRIERRTWIYKHYGIGPIATGFNSQNLWAAMPRIYRFYQWSGENSGPHTCIGYEEFCAIAKAANAGEGDDLTKVKTLIESVLNSAFYTHGGQGQDDQSRTLLEKTPMHLKYADVILNSFPEAKVIEVVRDVRGMCASWQARSVNQKWARKPIEGLIDQWTRSLERTDRFRNDQAIGDRILQVRYEDLRQNTAGSLKNIFEFLEMPLPAENLNHIAAKFDISQAKSKGEGLHVRKGIIGAWRTDLSQEDIDTCNRLAGPWIEKLGYSVA